MEFAVVAPYLGMLGLMLLAAWQARARSGNDISIDAGESLLRQYEAQTRELRAAQRAERKAEWAYLDLLQWAERKAEWAYLDLLQWGIRVQQQVAQEAPGVQLPPMPRRAINGDTPHDLPPLTDRDEARLRKVLVDRMEVADLRTLAFDLGCEDLAGQTTGEMARSLLDYVRTRRKGPELLKWLADNRPDIKA